MCARKKWITTEELKDLAGSLEGLVNEFAAKRGKTIDALSFASFVSDNGGYTFTQPIQWEILEEVVDKAGKTYTNFSSGQIAEMLSMVVNTPACNCKDTLH